MKKAQVSQAFIYIMALIVLATVFVFGYKAVNHFLSEGEKVEFITFQTDIQQAIGSISSDIGSVVVYNAKNRLSVPGRYRRVCFIDVDVSPPSSCPEELGLLACDSWQEYHNPLLTQPFENWRNAEANVFLDPPGLIPLKVGRIKVGNDGYLCIPTKGRLDIKLTGRGSHAIIESLI